MSEFTFALDVKSFYFNIENDNEKGHTATVATVLKQGKSINPALSLFEASSSNIPLTCTSLISECTKNSKTEVRINNILVFDDIYLNGEKIDTGCQFCIYLKQEIDKTKVQYGRIKLHYPISLKYSDYQYDIDNRMVLDMISSRLHDYAFLVSKFQLFDKPGKINFITSLIGPNKIPYSKVFLNYKGDANQKFNQIFNEIAGNYEIEAPLMRQYGIPGIELINPSTYGRAYDYCKRKAIKLFEETLEQSGAKDIQVHTDQYPYDICDIEAIENGEKHYFIINFTATKQDYFFISVEKYIMAQKFKGLAYVILVKSILSDSPIIQRYESSELSSFEKTIEVLKLKK